MTNENLIKNTGGADLIDIISVVDQYFNGLFNGDTRTLKNIFKEDAFLKAPDFRLGRDAWLQAVAERPIPRDTHPRDNFRIESIELVQEQAMVKVKCPLFDHDYVDFLGLLKEGEQWRIVNKMFVDTSNMS